MRHPHGNMAVLLLSSLAMLSSARAEQGTGAKPQEGKSDVDPQAVAALDAMGRYLRTVKVFQVTAKTTTDEVLEDGQRIQFAGTLNLVARRPDRLLVNLVNDQREREYLYDGKSVTVWAPLMEYYAVVPAPPTLEQVFNQFEERYGIELPLVDLFRWGAPGYAPADIKAAIDVGPSEVEGTTCEHYAFRQAGLDWQVWIQQGDFPLPRELVLTTLTDEARPQYSVVLTWNLAPSFNEQSFSFTPPATARMVPLAEIPARGDANKGSSK